MARYRSFESYEEEYSYKCYERELADEEYDEELLDRMIAELDEELDEAEKELSK